MPPLSAQEQDDEQGNNEAENGGAFCQGGAQQQVLADLAFSFRLAAEGKAAAEAEHARRLRDANAETSALARDMCEKLLARNLTQQDDARLLDDLLQKAGDSNGK